MPAERDDGVVVRVLKPLLLKVVVVHAVVIVGVHRVLSRVALLVAGRAHRHAQVPQLHRLVFAVAEDVPPIAFTVNVRQPFDMAHECAGFPPIGHRTPVPHFDDLVVGPGVDDVRVLWVRKADRIDVVIVAHDVVQYLPRLDVIHHDGGCVVSGNQLTSVATEADRPDREVTACAVAPRCLPRAGAKVELVRVAFVVGVRGAEGDVGLEGGVGKPLVVGGQVRVGERPLAPVVGGCFVVTPVIRIRGIVHAHFEVFDTGVEKVAVFRELTAVDGRGVVDQ